MYFLLQQAWKFFSELWPRNKIEMTNNLLVLIFLTLINAKTGRKPDTGQTGKFDGWIYMSMYTNSPALTFFDLTKRSAKTGSRTNLKILWMNVYVNTNSPALNFFRFDNQKYKNRTLVRKIFFHKSCGIT